MEADPGNASWQALVHLKRPDSGLGDGKGCFWFLEIQSVWPVRTPGTLPYIQVCLI